MSTIRRKRLKEWFAGKSMPEKEKSYLSQLVKGKASFGEKAARRLERDYGMPPGYLDQPSPPPDATEEDGDTICIPMLDEINKNVMAHAAISNAWLKRHFSVSAPANLRWMICPGDSMSPGIKSGDPVLIDTGVTYIQQEGIYVLARAEELFIKRVQRDLSGALMILSDNKAYETLRPVDDDWANLAVRGKAICVWNCQKL